MKIWKKGLRLAVAFSLAGSLAACGTGQNQISNAQQAKPNEKVKLVYARGKDVTPGTRKLIAAFEARHPNIQIESREMPADVGQSHDQYVTMFSAKSSEIDVFDLDVVWPAEFAQAGYIWPLNRFIERDHINMNNYIQGAVDAGNYNGKQWAMPKFIDTGLLFYRKDIVKQPPKTWDELIAMAEKTKGEKGTKFGYLMQAKQYEGVVCNFIEFVNAYGGKVIDEKGDVVINSPNTVKGLKKMIQIVQSEYVPSNIKTFTELESHTAFIEGQSPLIRNWPYQYELAQDPAQSKISGKVGVAPLPAGDAGSAAALGGWLIGINKYSKHPQEAWEFVKFMTGAEGQKITALYGGSAPTYLPLYNDAAIKKNELFGNKNFVQGIKAAVPRPVSPIYPKISDIIQIEVSKALAGEQTPKQSVKNMEIKMKEAMKG
ncbi:ABC transporter substrate-binding protein [Aneurinibacillus terranovensis]|uniref:ABC transporter substrate-binding protein n=1 Tax=Aneurinibacillus terranovensis TaxID=278991 RepID=UPI0004179050|nr:ABC transporter substrate-binding protein [Aneurinibacillus terranovensis]